MWLSYDQIIALVRGAGREPVERDSLYQTVRTFEDWVPGRAPARPEGPAGPSFKIVHRRAAAARGGRGGRGGRALPPPPSGGGGGGGGAAGARPPISPPAPRAPAPAPRRSPP